MKTMLFVLGFVLGFSLVACSSVPQGPMPTFAMVAQDDRPQAQVDREGAACRAQGMFTPDPGQFQIYCMKSLGYKFTIVRAQ